MTGNGNKHLITTIISEILKRDEIRYKWVLDEILVMLTQYVANKNKIYIKINKILFNHSISNDPKHSTIDDLQAVNSTGLYTHFGCHKVQVKLKRLRAYFIGETNKIPHPINSNLISDLDNIFYDLILLEQSKNWNMKKKK